MNGSRVPMDARNREARAWRLQDGSAERWHTLLPAAAATFALAAGFDVPTASCRQILRPGRAEVLHHLRCHPNLPVGILGLLIDPLGDLD
jgi:hypothetical protein